MLNWYRTYDAKRFIGVLFAIIIVGAVNYYRLQTKKASHEIEITFKFFHGKLNGGDHG